MIFCASPHQQFLALKEEIHGAIDRVLESGHYILGEEVSQFEREFSSFIGVKDFVGVGNGTDAIYMALVAAGIGRGDEVVTTAHTAVATVSAIVQAGATPVFADIEADFYTLDPAAVRKVISKKTKAIILVHIYGQSCAMDEFMEISRENNILLIEDCAQAHGATFRDKKLGSIGHVSCFSFYPTKNLGAIGDGGGVGTSNPEIAEKLRALRQYGWRERYISETHGWNSRLDEIQAAILRIKLRHLQAENDSRRKYANLYFSQLSQNKCLLLPKVRPGGSHVFHLFAVLCERRDALINFLKQRGIQALIHYPRPIHLQPGYEGICKSSELSNTERLSRQTVSLPMHPYLGPKDIEIVSGAVNDFFQS